MDNKIITVVLADANEEFRSMLKESVESTGEFAVVGTAGDGLSALRLIEEKKPQMLLTEVLLPELDGFGLLDRMASWETKPKIVFVSQAYRGDIVARAMAMDISYFMPKPFDMNSLLERMRQIISADAEEEEASGRKSNLTGRFIPSITQRIRRINPFIPSRRKRRTNFTRCSAR